jgi:7-keto-8-aminopelargonate synthetase-like enzyme
MAESRWMMESPPGALAMLNGRTYLYFAGTGYLGLQGRPAVVEAAAEAARRYGVHSATTRGGFGNTPVVDEVERRAAAFLGAEDALYLASGYAANFALAAALSDQVELVLIDEHAHDSLRESARMLARLAQPPIPFRTRDAESLCAVLARSIRPGRRVLVVTDGVSPATGELAPLGDYLDVLGRYDRTMLLVDDAHGLGVLGPRGRGSLELAGVGPERINQDPDRWIEEGPRVFHAATLSKAVGGHGGIVAGGREFLARVRRSSGWARGASAPTAAAAAASSKGLELLQCEPGLREELATNVLRLREALRAAGFPAAMLPTPIVSLRLESARRMEQVQQGLEEAGVLVAHTRDYGGVGPEGVLRIAVFATHAPEMIGRLVGELARVAPRGA